MSKDINEDLENEFFYRRAHIQFNRFGEKEAFDLGYYMKLAVLLTSEQSQYLRNWPRELRSRDDRDKLRCEYAGSDIRGPSAQNMFDAGSELAEADVNGIEIDREYFHIHGKVQEKPKA